MRCSTDFFIFTNISQIIKDKIQKTIEIIYIKTYTLIEMRRRKFYFAMAY